MIKTLSKGITCNCIQSNKFKDICISINFFNKNDDQNSTERSLLSMMLVDRCMKYDTKKKMSDMCDHLYGCTLGSRVLTYGKAHCIEIRSKIINPKFIQENHNVCHDWLNFISETIFNPLLNEALFDENKKILTSRIRRKEDDAQTYTIGKALEMAGKKHSLSIPARGNLKTLEDLTLEDIKKQYQKMIDEDQIEILICGDFDEIQMMKQVQSKLNFKDRNSNYENYYVIESNDGGTKEEEKNNAQTNIAMVYSTGISVKDKEFAALKVANGIFGQLPSSYLFQVVREQHSLCYSIISSLISYDGACLITTGIEKENIEKTISLIRKQLKRCQTGDFSDEMLETTKNMLVNALIASLDDMSSIIGYNLGNSILKREYTIEENIQNVMNVTKEECIEVFNKMKHMATYICIGKEEENE